MCHLSLSLSLAGMDPISLTETPERNNRVCISIICTVITLPGGISCRLYLARTHLSLPRVRWPSPRPCLGSDGPKHSVAVSHGPHGSKPKGKSAKIYYIIGSTFWKRFSSLAVLWEIHLNRSAAYFLPSLLRCCQFEVVEIFLAQATLTRQKSMWSSSAR